MKRTHIVTLRAWLLPATLLVLVLAPAASASGTAFSFNLSHGPNTSEDPSTGDTIRITGSGAGGAASAGSRP